MSPRLLLAVAVLSGAVAVIAFVLVAVGMAMQPKVEAAGPGPLPTFAQTVDRDLEAQTRALSERNSAAGPPVRSATAAPAATQDGAPVAPDPGSVNNPYTQATTSAGR